MLKGFDSWYTSIPESHEMPSGSDITGYNCVNCGGEFTDLDINSENYKVEYEFEINGWSIQHIDCERGLLP